MSRVLVGLGSNLGDRAATLSAAIAALGSMPGVVVQATSTWHEMRPVGGPADQPPYLNAAVVLESSLDPDALLTEFQRIESALGRRREIRWGPRTIDLDLLLFEDWRIDTPRLVVPHPWLAVRRFVLAPAVEVAADWPHPVFGWTLGRLLAHLNDAPNYLALCGPPGVGKTRVAELLAAERGLRLLLDPEATPPRPSASPGPTSPGWEAQLEFMAHSRRGLCLVSHRWGGPTDWSVSDFWFGQSLAYAALNLTPDGFAHYEQHWHKAAARVDKPKLLVLLNPPWESVYHRQPVLPKSPPRLADWLPWRPRGARSRAAAGPPQAADWICVREKLVELVLRPGWGPVLHLRQPEPAAIVAQLGAAIDAMQ